MPELCVLETLSIKGFRMLVRGMILHIFHGGLPDQIGVERIALLLLLLLLPELFCHFNLL